MEEEIKINTVVLGGIAGTATVIVTGEKVNFVNPSALALVANVTKSMAQINRLGTGNPPKQVVAIISRLN